MLFRSRLRPVVLDGLDHLVKRELKVRGYLMRQRLRAVGEQRRKKLGCSLCSYSGLMTIVT